MTVEINSNGRAAMIEVGIPEDAVDLYIEKIQRELRDPRLQLCVRVYPLVEIITDLEIMLRRGRAVAPNHHRRR